MPHLNGRDITLLCASLAPLDQLRHYKEQMGWRFPWVSSLGSDFNYDFGVTLDPAVAPPVYNYRPLDDYTGALPGVSTFLRDGDRVFHTYSSYARGGDLQLGTYNWLDLTALGRQEDWEEPAGRSDGPLMSWVRRHDEYPQAG